MTPGQLVDAYAEATARLEEMRMDTKGRGRNADVLTEAAVRAHQALYALARFRSIEIQPNHREEVPCPDLSASARARLASNLGAPELQFYAESFYQVAFRLRELVRLVPGLKRFEAVGVRGTRNWLIQHAEREQGVLNQNYAYDIPEGFNLKPFGGNEALRPKSGLLYPDAEEFVTELLRRIDGVRGEKHAMDRQLRIAVLEGLSKRPSGHGYAALELPGYPADDIERTVIALHREGLVNAHHIPHGLGPGRDRVEPSTLTDKGRMEMDR